MFHKLDNTWYGNNNITDNVHNLLSNIKNKTSFNPNNIKALIVPHAGYKYSGLCAAYSYSKLLKQSKPNKYFKSVVILSTRHSGKKGIVIPKITKYLITKTNNKIYYDINKINTLLSLNNPLVLEDNDEFEMEHSVEIQLPFIEYCLPNAKIIILLIGELYKNNLKIAANKLEEINDSKTLWILSTDFSHVNGNFNYKIRQPNITNKIIQTESEYMNILLKINKDSGSDLLKIHKKYKASICGINVLKLWCNIKFIKQYNGHISCTYNSKQLEPFNNIKIDNSRGVVSYISCIYIKNKLNTIDNIFTLFEQEQLLRFAISIIFNKINPNHPILNILTCPSYKNKNYGLFVTLKKNKKLRGCIGTIIPTDGILNLVNKLSLSSAFNDNRFKPIKNINEFNYLSITLLDKEKQITDIKEWKIHKDGIIIKSRYDKTKSAIFLPSVPTEQKWDKIKTLKELSLKARLDENDWKYENLFIIPGYTFSIG